MNDQNYFILLIILAVLLPLIPSVILFKFLPNDATVQGPFQGMKTKFSGAFAGYFVTLLFIGTLMKILQPSAPYIPYEVWRIKGQAVLGNEDKLLPTDITINPPNVNVSQGGTFYLDLPVMKRDRNILNFPTISVAHPGFNSIDIPLGDNTITSLGRMPVTVIKDPASKSITINPFELNRMAPYNQGGVQ